MGQNCPQSEALWRTILGGQREQLAQPPEKPCNRRQQLSVSLPLEPNRGTKTIRNLVPRNGDIFWVEDKKQRLEDRKVNLMWVTEVVCVCVCVA